MEDRWLSRQEAAGYLGVSPHTMRAWAVERKGPRFSKAAGRARYWSGDLRDFMQSGYVDWAL
ncbi:helix-turn-helix transcriptional regulator [Nocardia terrae]|uniref:helix-turn-helix transcriptional regulator n=1 Tax=Nocardia terrae TaxID=2675851 RepID=UPI0038B40765